MEAVWWVITLTRLMALVNLGGWCHSFSFQYITMDQLKIWIHALHWLYGSFPSCLLSSVCYNTTDITFISVDTFVWCTCKSMNRQKQYSKQNVQNWKHTIVTGYHKQTDWQDMKKKGKNSIIVKILFTPLMIGKRAEKQACILNFDHFRNTNVPKKYRLGL